MILLDYITDTPLEALVISTVTVPSATSAGNTNVGVTGVTAIRAYDGQMIAVLDTPGFPEFFLIKTAKQGTG